MDKQIVTTLLIIAAVVCFALAFEAIYPAVVRSSDAMVSASRATSDRLRTDIQIIHAAGELDASGLWHDVDGDGSFGVFVWAKNTGSLSISAPSSCDLFFGHEGNFLRVLHEDDAQGSYPYWTYSLENGSRWEPTGTIRITIHHTTVLASGRYFVKVVTPNGRTVETFFGM
jgi:archaellum component FlaG (FlaF/FlaG flagellin family)